MPRGRPRSVPFTAHRVGERIQLVIRVPLGHATSRVRLFVRHEEEVIPRFKAWLNQWLSANPHTAVPNVWSGDIQPVNISTRKIRPTQMRLVKRCRRCGHDLPATDFGKDRNKHDGRSIYCKSCVAAYARQWKSTHREAHRVYVRKTRAKIATDPQRLEKRREAGRRYYRPSFLKSRYGLSIDQYEKMLSDQHCACAVCGKGLVLPNIAVDHDHQTKRIRGLLCLPCNSGIGMFRDDINLLRLAIAYLEAFANAT